MYYSCLQYELTYIVLDLTLNQKLLILTISVLGIAFKPDFGVILG